jgi:uncharacterized Tic20 family protein
MYNSDNRKLLSALSHGSIFFSVTLLAIGVPIAILFLSDDPVVKDNSKEAINFHLNVWFLGAIIGGIIGFLSFITFGLLGFILGPIIGIGFLLHWGLTIWAILQCLSNPDKSVRYPFIFRIFN